MSTTLLKTLSFVFLLAACSRQVHKTKEPLNNSTDNSVIPEQPGIAANKTLNSLMDLPQTQNGGFVLSPGFYEAEFKTYCLQPGTPDPSQGDAYLQGPVTGYRKDIIESVLLNSREKPELEQRNIQLLLWSVVSGSNFDKLSQPVQADAMKLLTPKQIFTLKGGVAGLVKTV